MPEDNLKKYALFAALLGILLLLFIKDQIEIQNTSIEDLNVSMLDQKVSIIGTISSVTKSNSSYFVILNNKIGISIFSKEDLKFKENTPLKTEGILAEYNKNLVIRADKVWL
jgi:hypothetical protein